jgi:hypothetical protein
MTNLSGFLGFLGNLLPIFSHRKKATACLKLFQGSPI